MTSFIFTYPTAVSTHSPRGGRTPARFGDCTAENCFNSLAPRGANPFNSIVNSYDCKFQLTRPAGGEPEFIRQPHNQRRVSTHSPRGGRTATLGELLRQLGRFNSLAPRGANPDRDVEESDYLKVSTHSPRGGRTVSGDFSCRFFGCFNSLAPRGANPVCGNSEFCSICEFQLTRPAGGEPCESIERERLQDRFQLTRPAGGEPFSGIPS